VLERAVEKRRLRLADGRELEGARLVRVLERMTGVLRLIEMLGKKHIPAALLDLMLKGEVRDAAVFSDKTRLQALIQPLRAQGTDVVLEKDEEHSVFELVLQVGQNGSTREVRVGDEFVGSPEYRALVAAYEEIRDADHYPLQVVTENTESLVESRDALVAHMQSEGRKGLTIQRYKGLGEMNAEQLWDTTMNPENRTLLQVRLEDEEVAENLFTTLMGDAVEPRRQFIEDNALNVRNLDV
jgi:DNA gyrase subunit B